MEKMFSVFLIFTFFHFNQLFFIPPPPPVNRGFHVEYTPLYNNHFLFSSKSQRRDWQQLTYQHD